jgi:hypothetical protein
MENTSTALAVRAPVIPDTLAGEDPGDFTSLPPVVGTVTPPPVAEDVAAIIARLDARNADIIRHSAEVLTYERKRPPVSMVGRDSRSSRPMCAGCGYGIRKETRQVEGPQGVYHPNCAKVAAGAADATKISPRFLAAIVPLTQIRLSELRALPAPTIAEVTPEPEPEVEPQPPVEDSTTDQVAAAVANSRRSGKRNRAS